MIYRYNENQLRVVMHDPNGHLNPKALFGSFKIIFRASE